MNVIVRLVSWFCLRVHALVAVGVCSVFVSVGLADDTTNPSELAFFNSKVLPLFEEHCFECHSHQSKKAKGGLVLDSRAGWEVGGDSGPAVQPGDANASLLMQAVLYGDLEMPPSGRLPSESIELLRRWIDAGAIDPRGGGAVAARKDIDLEQGKKHWAFQPLNRPNPGVFEGEVDGAWPLEAIDRFILRRLEEAGVSPNDDADPFTWLRRVFLDLSGLPPSPADIRAFALNSSALAREQVVDRLLASRAFGERWSRHWLDLVGYADQIGTSNNVFAQHAWRYRDYVIDAFNHDKPFDQFIREQVAGDQIQYTSANDRAASITATGFLVLGDIEIVEADKAKLLVDIVDQQLNKVGKAFLGLTLECARCHDHKFDPISQRDYFAMAGFFHSTSSIFKTKRGVWSDVNVSDLPETVEEKEQRLRAVLVYEERLGRWNRERTAAEKAQEILDHQLKSPALAKGKKAQIEKERNELAKRIGELSRTILHASFFKPSEPQAHAVKDAERVEDMRMTIRANPRALAERVPRGFIQVLSQRQQRPSLTDTESGRRQLADWIVEQALTARVATNRIWQKLFGEGLVRTVDYFGLPGERPSHPLLLDFLSTQFVEQGWSQKKLIKSLVLSRAYGLSSSHNDRAHQIDPENRLLWRMNRVRLDAEAIRDSMLFVSGQLLQSSGGPGIPLEYPENVGGLDPKDVNPPSFRLAKWRPGQRLERTVYLPVIRHAAQPGPAMLRNVFDFAQPSQFVGKRPVTAVPTQALFLMNSHEVKGHAASLATRMSRLEKEDSLLESLWLIVLGRPISESEKTDASIFLSQDKDNSLDELCRALLASNEFLMHL